MNRLALASPRLRRFMNRQTLFVAVAVCTVWFLGVQFRGDASQHWSELGNNIPDLREQPKRMPTDNVLPPLADRVPCHGPRGYLLGQSKDDDLEERELDGRMR
jgi:biotin synthase